MWHFLRCGFILGSFFIVCFLPRLAWTAVMTFDALPADFSEITSYTEEGITFAAVDGAPDYFHTEDNFDDGTTGAIIFSDDGNPFRISFGGALFNLLSLDVFDIDTGSGPVVFTTSGGATQAVNSFGLVNFGSAFAQTAFVQIDIPGGADDRFIGLDSISVGTSAVPEPSTLGLALLGAVSLLGVRCCVRKQRRSCVNSRLLKVIFR